MTTISDQAISTLSSPANVLLASAIAPEVFGGVKYPDPDTGPVIVKNLKISESIRGKTSYLLIFLPQSNRSHPIQVYENTGTPAAPSWRWFSSIAPTEELTDNYTFGSAVAGVIKIRGETISSGVFTLSGNVSISAFSAPPKLTDATANELSTNAPKDSDSILRANLREGVVGLMGSKVNRTRALDGPVSSNTAASLVLNSGIGSNSAWYGSAGFPGTFVDAGSQVHLFGAHASGAPTTNTYDAVLPNLFRGKINYKFKFSIPGVAGFDGGTFKLYLKVTTMARTPQTDREYFTVDMATPRDNSENCTAWIDFDTSVNVPVYRIDVWAQCDTPAIALDMATILNSGSGNLFDINMRISSNDYYDRGECSDGTIIIIDNVDVDQSIDVSSEIWYNVVPDAKLATQLKVSTSHYPAFGDKEEVERWFNDNPTVYTTPDYERLLQKHADDITAHYNPAEEYHLGKASDAEDYYKMVQNVSRRLQPLSRFITDKWGPPGFTDITQRKMKKLGLAKAFQWGTAESKNSGEDRLNLSLYRYGRAMNPPTSDQTDLGPHQDSGTHRAVDPIPPPPHKCDFYRNNYPQCEGHLCSCDSCLEVPAHCDYTYGKAMDYRSCFKFKKPPIKNTWARPERTGDKVCSQIVTSSKPITTLATKFKENLEQEQADHDEWFEEQKTIGNCADPEPNPNPTPPSSPIKIPNKRKTVGRCMDLGDEEEGKVAVKNAVYEDDDPKTYPVQVHSKKTNASRERAKLNRMKNGLPPTTVELNQTRFIAVAQHDKEVYLGTLILSRRPFRWQQGLPEQKVQRCVYTKVRAVGADTVDSILNIDTRVMPDALNSIQKVMSMSRSWDNYYLTVNFFLDGVDESSLEFPVFNLLNGIPDAAVCSGKVLLLNGSVGIGMVGGMQEKLAFCQAQDLTFCAQAQRLMAVSSREAVTLPIDLIQTNDTTKQIGVNSVSDYLLYLYTRTLTSTDVSKVVQVSTVEPITEGQGEATREKVLEMLDRSREYAELPAMKQMVDRLKKWEEKMPVNRKQDQRLIKLMSQMQDFLTAQDLKGKKQVKKKGRGTKETDDDLVPFYIDV